MTNIDLSQLQILILHHLPSKKAKLIDGVNGQFLSMDLAVEPYASIAAAWNTYQSFLAIAVALAILPSRRIHRLANMPFLLIGQHPS